jgi:exopolyphosphatase / guanosine-5'-triphosphate,3'-diphosphate pyrophosphatase
MQNNNLKKLAAIDIGTNSFHLIVTEIDEKGNFVIIDRLKEVVRLGVSSTDMKYLSEDAMNRGIEVLKRFKTLSDIHKAKIIAVATSAVRESLNRSEFLRRVKDVTGIEIEVISGIEEARLIYLGVLQSLPVFKQNSLVIDIGGGSTEFILGYKGEMKFAESLKFGSIRYTQKYFRESELKMKDVFDCRDEVRGVLNPIIRRLKKEKIDSFIGTSGTIMNIAGIIKDKQGESDYLSLNHFTFTAKDLQDVINLLLSKKNIQERAKIDGLDPIRADIIIAGALILEQIFSELKIREMTISDYALREGVILNSIYKEPGINKTFIFSNIRNKSVQHLMEIYNTEQKHARQVTSLSLSLFDQLNNIHKLGRDEREYLESASLLHDIGYYISHTQHHRHSYYLIRNAELPGFNDHEIEIIANVARYHRKSHPKIKHEGFSKLVPDDQERVRRLASIIRIADGLDRTHKSLVTSIKAKVSGDTVGLKLSCKDDKDIALDIWGAERKLHLFQEVFGYKVKLIY